MVLLSETFKVLIFSGKAVNVKMPNGDWTRILGLVENSEDLGGILLSHERIEDFDFSYLYQFSEVTFMSNKLKPIFLADLQHPPTHTHTLKCQETKNSTLEWKEKDQKSKIPHVKNVNKIKNLVWHLHNILLPYITVEEYFIIYFTFMFNLYSRVVVDELFTFIVIVNHF